MRIINKTKYQILMMYIVVFLMLTGNVVSSNIRIWGLVLSAYRVFIPFCFSLFIGLRFYKRSVEHIFRNHMLILYCGMIILWVVWGIGLLLISPYVNIREALKDLLSLILGMASIYCFWEICDNEDILKKVFKCIRIICMILSIWALFEILTGVYSLFSKYYWLEIVERKDWVAVGLEGLKDDSIYFATTIFHNVNDFSCFLAIFLPLFFVTPENTKKENILRSIGLLFILFILSVNDSNIAIISISVATIFYFIFSKNKKYAGGLLALSFAFLSFGNKIICSFFIFIKSHLPIAVPASANKYGSILDLIKIKNMIGLKETVEIQVMDAMGGSANSLMCRWQITLTSLRMTAKSKLMGIGPSAFTNFIERNEKDSLLVDPHNWWLEILSQYGIIIFILYVTVMAWIFVSVCLIYKKTGSYVELTYLCMCLIFCLACIAPSNYLKCTYQWILPAIGIVLIGFDQRLSKEQVFEKKR